LGGFLNYLGKFCFIWGIIVLFEILFVFLGGIFVFFWGKYGGAIFVFFGVFFVFFGGIFVFFGENKSGGILGIFWGDFCILWARF
jgi:hypothetical protein